ncbi:hypothetical protein, partial [Rheinheimera sp.]|uniref:hypothetical protein n=1 Tax=Rheinheimera sp. TaxID=1869214 RepID=UPI00273436D1
NPVLTVRQGGTGNIQIWKDGNNEVGTFADGGLFGLGTTTPKSRLSVSTLAQAAATTKLFTVASTTGATLFQVTANGQSLFAAGSVSAPSASFVGDTDTGLYAVSANIFGLAAGGTQVAQVKNGGTAQTTQFIVSPGALLGTTNTPSLAFGDGDTGFYESGDDSLYVMTGGNALLGLGGASGGYWVISTSALYNSTDTNGAYIANITPTAIAPAYTFVSDTNTGLGYSGADQLSVIAGGVMTQRSSSTAVYFPLNVGMGTTTPKSVLSVSTLAQAPATTKLFTVASTTGATFFQVMATGKVGVNTANPSAYLHVQGTTEQLRLAYDSNNYTAFTTDATGDLTIAPSGGDTNITG